MYEKRNIRASIPQHSFHGQGLSRCGSHESQSLGSEGLRWLLAAHRALGNQIREAEDDEEEGSAANHKAKDRGGAYKYEHIYYILYEQYS